MKHNVVGKNPESILLNSRNATTISNSKSRAWFELREAITIPNNMHAYIGMTACRFANIFYQISATKNEFSYRLSSDFYGTLHTVSITPGNYNAESLVLALNTETADHSFNFAYNPATFKVTISNSVWGFQLVSSSIHSILGISATATGETNYTGVYAIDLAGVKVVDIGIPNLGLHSNGPVTTPYSIINSVIVNGAPGYTIHLSQTNPMQFKVSQPVISGIEVVFYGDGELLDFLGSDWTVQLSLVYQYIPRVKQTERLMADLESLGREPEN